MNEREADELFVLTSGEQSNMKMMREGRATPLEDVGDRNEAGPSALHDTDGLEHEDDQGIDPRLQEAARRAAGQPPPRPPKPKPGEDEEGEEEEEGRQKTVPHQALHQERERRKQAEDRARDYEQKLNMAAMRLQAILEAQQRIPVQPAPPQPAPPQWRVDPIRAGESMEQRLARLEAERQQEAQQRAWEAEQYRIAQAQEQTWNAIYGEAMQDWQQYKTERPEALSAYQHLLASRERELQASRLTPDQVEQQLAYEESNAVLRARQTGMRLGDYVIAMAEARGWSPGANGGNGADVLTPAERVERTREGQTRSRSMGSSRGTSSANARMTLDRLLNMSDGDFARFKDRNPQTFRELLGG